MKRINYLVMLAAAALMAGCEDHGVGSSDHFSVSV